MDDVVILSAVRTPIGAFQGALAGLPAPALGRPRAGRPRSSGRGSTPADVEQVNMGCVLTAGSGPGAGAPGGARRRLPGVDRRAHPQQGLRLGDAGGDDRRQRPALRRLHDGRGRRHGEHEPGALPRAGRARRPAPRPRQARRLDDPRRPLGPLQRHPHGQLRRALRRRVRAQPRGAGRLRPARATAAPARRTEKGRFAEEIVPVEVPAEEGRDASSTATRSRSRSTSSRMAALKPAFQKDGTVTAGNASKINDGAAALVLTTAARGRAARAASRWRASSPTRRWRRSRSGSPPRRSAPSASVLERAGLKAADIDLWEVNEAFAVVALAFLRDLGLDADRVNVRGGAVALGHPIGASGARILVTLLHALRERGAPPRLRRHLHRRRRGDRDGRRAHRLTRASWPTRSTLPGCCWRSAWLRPGSPRLAQEPPPARRPPTDRRPGSRHRRPGDRVAAGADDPAPPARPPTPAQRRLRRGRQLPRPPPPDPTASTSASSSRRSGRRQRLRQRRRAGVRARGLRRARGRRRDPATRTSTSRPTAPRSTSSTKVVTADRQRHHRPGAAPA